MSDERFEQIGARLKALPFVDFKDKFLRGKGFTSVEGAAFSGLCAAGNHQILDCYKYSQSALSPLDVHYACQGCPESLQDCDSLVKYSPRGDARLEPSYIYSVVPPPDISKCKTDEEYELMIRGCTWVYFVSDGDAVKIGVAKDPLGRVSDLQVSNPRELCLLFAIPFASREDALRAEYEFHHKVFSRYRVRGEWYDLVCRLNLINWRRLYPLHDVPGYDENYGE